MVVNLNVPVTTPGALITTSTGKQYAIKVVTFTNTTNASKVINVYTSVNTTFNSVNLISINVTIKPYDSFEYNETRILDSGNSIGAVLQSGSSGDVVCEINYMSL